MLQNNTTQGTYTPNDLAKARGHGDVTRNGIAFDWWLASSAGAGFALYREPRHTGADIEAAAHYLRSERDVVTLRVLTPEPTEADWIAADLANSRNKVERHDAAAFALQIKYQHIGATS